MAIKGLNKNDFKLKLNECLSASGPVRSIQHLYGREKEMALIDEALCSDERHIFIFGDRGVGKTSLAAAAANLYQDSSSSHIQIGCGPDTSFYKTIEDLADRIIKKASGKRDYEATHSVNVKIYSIKWKKKDQQIAIPSVNSISSSGVKGALGSLVGMSAAIATGSSLPLITALMSTVSSGLTEAFPVISQQQRFKKNPLIFGTG